MPVRTHVEKNAVDKNVADRLAARPHDLAACRVLDIGYPRYAECLCSGPNSCSYALPFGYGYLCQHPKLNEIMEGTKRAASRPISK